MQCGHCAMRSRGISFALLVKIHHHCCIAVARPPRDKEISGNSGNCGHSTPVRAGRSAALLTGGSNKVFGYRHSTVSCQYVLIEPPKHARGPGPHGLANLSGAWESDTRTGRATLDQSTSRTPPNRHALRRWKRYIINHHQQAKV